MALIKYGEGGVQRFIFFITNRPPPFHFCVIVIIPKSSLLQMGTIREFRKCFIIIIRNRQKVFCCRIVPSFIWIERFPTRIFSMGSFSTWTALFFIMVFTLFPIVQHTFVYNKYIWHPTMYIMNTIQRSCAFQQYKRTTVNHCLTQ